MIPAHMVSAVLVTRGDQDLAPIYESLSAAGITDVVTWNNAERENLSCYGRFAGIREAKNPIIFHQDDDLVSPVGELLKHYDPVLDRWAIVANNRIDEEWPLCGIGSVFHRSLADCFHPYIERYGYGPEFFRICDVVFAYSWPYRRVALGYSDLPWASAAGASMYLEEGHYHVRVEARKRVMDLLLEKQ